MVTKQKILIVDDDENIAELISLYLTKECFDTMIVHDGEEALTAFESYQPNLMLLDLMLPGIDGYQVCREIRSKHNTPIIMLSAKGEVFDKVLGLELGADDYVLKPFDSKELVARVKAVLRRCGKAQGTLAAFDVVLDPAARRVTRSGTPLHLTPREFDLLEVLLRNRGIVLYREVLYERVWGLDAEYDSRTLDLHIQRLRKKLGWKNEIRTVFRVGYVLERGE